MAGKKLSKKDKDRLTIAIIIASAIVCVLCVGSELIKVVPDIVKKEVGGIVSNVGDAVNVTDSVIGKIDRIESVDTEKMDDAGLDVAEIVRVVDGDTYILDIDGEETRVRLIGVDTPESVAPEGYKENTSEGKLISNIVKEKMATVSYLSIEYDVERTDKYGRMLAYLYFPDGTMVQDWLLENGYANVAIYAPNTKYEERFKNIVAERGDTDKEAA